MSEERKGNPPSISPEALEQARDAEERKGDPALDEVEPASIELPEGEPRGREPRAGGGLLAIQDAASSTAPPDRSRV